MKRCLFPVVACLAGIAFAEVDPSSVDSSGHLTAAAYVQDGLVQLFDAIDNAGTGTHDPDATVWKDLKGDTTITVTSPAVWGERWLATKSTRQTISAIPAFYYNDVTTEVALDIIENYSSYPRIFVHNGGDGVWSVYFTGGGISPEIYANSSGTRPKFGVFRDGTISVVGDNSGIYGYNNSYTNDATIRTSSKIASPGSVQVASKSGYISGNTGTLDGLYRSFRHYTRALSEDEVSHNAVIDGLRYFSFTCTGSGTSTPVAWEDVAWTAPYGIAAASPRYTAGDYAQLVNAKVSVANGQVLLKGLTLEGGAMLSLPEGVVASAKVLYVGGTAMPRGVYTGTGSNGTQVPWLEGAGSLYVAGGVDAEFQSTVLKAKADGSAGTFVAAEVQDQNDEPDYTDAAPVNLADPFGYYSLLLMNGYTFASSDLDFRLGAGGLRSVDAASATSYSVGFPVKTEAAQTWYIGTNTTVDMLKPLKLDAPLTIRGRGNLYLRSPAEGSAPVMVAGCADADSSVRSGANTRIYAYTNDVFGSSSVTVDVQHAQLAFIGDFIQNANVVTKCDKNDWDYYVIFKGNLTFNGKYEHRGQNMRPAFYRGRTVVFNGTYTTQSAMYSEARSDFSSTETAEVIFNKKLSVGDRFNVPAGMRITLNVATNRINGNKGGINGTIRCGCERALEFQNGSNGGTFFYPGSSGTLDMNGYDQGLGCIYSLNNAGIITSETPATLHLVDNYKIPDYDSGQKNAAGANISVFGYTNYAVFAGCASFSKEGQYTNRLKRVSSTFGDLSVSKGRLEFAPEATWLNASNLVVKGAGLFTLDDRSAAQGQPFGKQLDVHVEGTSAKIELKNAIPAVTRHLYVDGVRQRLGYWGSAEAAAANPSISVRTSAAFTGTGLLLANGEYHGTAILLR